MNSSTWSLCFANILALVVAVVSGWSLADLMLLYWLQSAIIGISYVFRILNLDKFSTENFTMNNRPVDPTPGTKRSVAVFFTFHYGIFHFVYLMFLISGAMGDAVFEADIFFCAAVFAINHGYSYRQNRERDEQGTPNIGTLMFTPYLRVIPMHMTIIFGSSLGLGGAGLILFGLLKTIADAIMHVVEHRVIGSS